jgi:hypothetical protein
MRFVCSIRRALPLIKVQQFACRRPARQIRSIPQPAAANAPCEAETFNYKRQFLDFVVNKR